MMTVILYSSSKVLGKQGYLSSPQYRGAPIIPWIDQAFIVIDISTTGVSDVSRQISQKKNGASMPISQVPANKNIRENEASASLVTFAEAGNAAIILNIVLNFILFSKRRL